MFNRRDFENMRKELDRIDREREKVIDLSRKIIKESKLIIYAVHRDSLHEAGKRVITIKTMLKKLPAEAYDTGMGTTARQEYVEALTFYHFVKDDMIPTADDLGVSVYEYLLGLCDLSGELMRKAIYAVIKDQLRMVYRIRDTVDALYHEFLKCNLRNGELRKKADQIKWNLEKIEGVIYDLAKREKVQ